MDQFNSLKFDEAPNYGLLKQLLLRAADEVGISLFDNVYDWQEKLNSGGPIRPQKKAYIFGDEEESKSEDNYGDKEFSDESNSQKY